MENVVTIVTECIIRGIQHDIYIYVYTQHDTPHVEKKVSRVSFMEVASRQDAGLLARENEEGDESSPDNSKSGK